MRAHIVLLAVLGLCSGAWAAWAPLGIDWGSAFTKAATLKSNEFAIVLNEAAARRTASAIGFDGKERLFGDSAAALRGRMPRSVFSGYHTLITAAGESEVASRVKSNPGMQFEAASASGRLALRTEDGQSFLPEELFGMSLHFLQRMAAEYSKGNVSACVLAVPGHLSAQARASLVDAGRIGGVRVQAVVNDHAALALQYGKERKWPADTGKVDRVLFVDVGAAFTRASVAEYAVKAGKQTVTVLAASYDPTLGGAQIDLELADMLADAFDKKHGLKLRSNPKAFAKLLREAEKLKRTLSANEEAVLSVGSLMNDLDFSLKVTRAEVEARCAALFSRVAAPIAAALSGASLPAGAAVDLAMPFGAGWRFPALRSAIEAVPGVGKLHNYINTDEAVALGAAFVHANVSGQLRVRPLVLVDKTGAPECSQGQCAPRLSEAAVLEAKERHQGLVAEERERKAVEYAKSELEAWIYARKELLMPEDDEAAVALVSTEEQREAASGLLDEAEGWLYDTEEITVALCAAKRAELGKVLEPIERRITEHAARPAAVQLLRAGIESAKAKAEDWKSSRPQIPPAKLQQLSTLAEEAGAWLDASERALEAAGLHVEAPFGSEEVKRRLEELKDLSATLRLIKPGKDDM